MSDQELLADFQRRRTIIDQCVEHFVKIRELAASIPASSNTMTVLETAACTLVANERAYVRPATEGASMGHISIAPSGEPEEIARRGAIERQQMLSRDEEVRRRDAARAAGDAGAGRLGGL
jgi:hypothetical protein